MSKKYLGRYRFIAGFVAFLFVVLVIQLFNLQIRDYDANTASADKKKTKTITSRFTTFSFTAILIAVLQCFRHIRRRLSM